MEERRKLPQSEKFNFGLIFECKKLLYLKNSLSNFNETFLPGTVSAVPFDVEVEREKEIEKKNIFIFRSFLYGACPVLSNTAVNEKK